MWPVWCEAEGRNGGLLSDFCFFRSSFFFFFSKNIPRLLSFVFRHLQTFLLNSFYQPLWPQLVIFFFLLMLSEEATEVTGNAFHNNKFLHIRKREGLRRYCMWCLCHYSWSCSSWQAHLGLSEDEFTVTHRSVASSM